jgi:hypothetical protein
MNALSPGDAAASTREPMHPLLDAALCELSEVDRSAILLRFFENQTFSVVGKHLRLSEDAARKRVDRALAKLHAALARRGIVSTSAALAVAISTQAIHAAPAGLAHAVSVLAIKSAASSSLAASILAFFAVPKLQLCIAATLAAIVGVGAARERSTISTLRAEIAQVTQTNHRVSAATVAARERYTASHAAFTRDQNSGTLSLDVPWNEGTIAWLFKSERDAYPNKWAAIVQRLNLQPDTITALVKLDFERRHVGRVALDLAQREGVTHQALAAHGMILAQAIDIRFEERYHALLGKDRFALLKEFQRTILARNALGGFATAAANANVPVSDLQMDALATLLTDADDHGGRMRTNRSSFFSDDALLTAVLTDPGFRLGRMLADSAAPMPKEILDQVRAVLTPEQHEKLAAFQLARLARREMEARNRVAAARGELRLNTASLGYYPAPNTAQAAAPAH